jgi:hypothetical protein
MNLKQALQRIEQLERRVKELEAKPMGETHHHYHYHQPQYQPYNPLYPYQPWCGNIGASVQATVTPALTFNG